MKIVVNDLGIIDITEDDWNDGYLEHVNVWNFSVQGTYDSAEQLIKAIQNATGMFYGLKPADFALDDYKPFSSLRASELVNVDNESPSEDEIERWKKGEIKLYAADLTLPVMVAEELRDMSREDADEFGFDIG